MIPAPTTMTSYGLLGPPIEVPGDVCNRRRAAGIGEKCKPQRRVAAHSGSHSGSTLQRPPKSNGSQYLASRRIRKGRIGCVTSKMCKSHRTTDAAVRAPWRMLIKVCDFGFWSVVWQRKQPLWPPKLATSSNCRAYSGQDACRRDPPEGHQFGCRRRLPCGWCAPVSGPTSQLGVVRVDKWRRVGREILTCGNLASGYPRCH
jgi:hypothetical protein